MPTHASTPTDSLAAFLSEDDLASVAAAGSPAVPVTSLGARRSWLRWAAAVAPALAAGVLGALVMRAVEPRAAAVPALGVATVTSTPSGVPVAIDGIARGATPLALALPAGPHRVSVGAGDAPTERRVQVSAGTDAFLHVEWPVTAEPAKTLAPAPAPTVVAMRPAPPRALVNVVETPRVRESIAFKPAPLGWVSVSSPFAVQVFEDGRDIGRSDGDRLPLAAGTHTLTLVNRSLEVSEERTITVVAKREVALTIEASRGTLNLNARPWAEVWLDGKRVGDTPLGNLSVAIGEHELLFRHPTLGDQRRRVVVGARSPVRVAVEYNP